MPLARWKGGFKNLVFVSSLYDVQPTSLTAPRTLEIYVEEASYTPNWKREPNVAFGDGYIRNIVSNFSVGIAYHTVSTTATEQFTAQIPHPFYFNQARNLEGESTDLSYKERAFHIPIGFTKASGRIVISVTAGPSYFLTETEIINDLNLSESYPYTSITLGAIETKIYDANVFGFNAGALFGVRIHRNFSVGVDLHYSSGKAKFTTDAGTEVELDAGGLFVGAGVQILF